MSDPIKLTDGEIAEIRMLREKFTVKTEHFGKLYLQKMENEFMDKLLQKYGEGNLDFQSGIFVPNVKK